MACTLDWHSLKSDDTECIRHLVLLYLLRERQYVSILQMSPYYIMNQKRAVVIGDDF